MRARDSTRRHLGPRAGTVPGAQSRFEQGDLPHCCGFDLDHRMAPERREPGSGTLPENWRTILDGQRRSFSWCLRSGLPLPEHPDASTYTRTISTAPGNGRLRGGVNALISAINSCRPDNSDPQQDVGWSLWTGLGLDELFDPTAVSPNGVFGRGGFSDTVKEVRAILDEGLPTDCDVVLGVSATRLESYPVEINESLSLPRQEEKFVVRIQGQGPGLPAKFTNYVDVTSGLPEALLSLRGDGSASDFNYIRDLVFASSAFPVAFAPQLLGYCVTDPHDASTWTCAEPTQVAAFIDGGVFDNNPLRLAADVAQFGLVTNEQGRGAWSEPRVDGLPDLRPQHVEMNYEYLDPDITSYPRPALLNAEDQSSTLNFALSLLGEFVTTARAKELYNRRSIRRTQLHRREFAGRRPQPADVSDLRGNRHHREAMYAVHVRLVPTTPVRRR